MASKRFGEIRHPKKRAFLTAFAKVGTVTHAAEIAGVNRDTHRIWLQKDPEYAAAFERAKDAFADLLEKVALERATEGWEEPVFQGGKEVGRVRKFSNTLLIFLLKGLRPDKYRERYEQKIVGGGDPVSVRLEGLSPEDIRALARLAGGKDGGDE